ncbi:MAG: putative ABC transporter ATP-binding protein YheS [Candidatus Dichloromethanomonas elyunquensis]|nr:MAG: putative ABC transporter ATP-binding protein YheS [Candidatus Dichloromethanomonas elyunquensis]
MSILLCKHLEIEASGSSLLKNISFRLEQGEKVGLVGANGAGKTTLLRVVMGEIPYEKGEINRPAAIGYLAQNAAAADGQSACTVFQSMLAERQDILEMREDLRFLEIRMSQEADGKTLEQYSKLTEKYELAGGYALEAQARKILAGLGLSQDHDKSCENLSGGQKTRLALGRLLLQQPELLILDEPTNHLDIEAIEWLENYLDDFPGSVLVVSHDRYFLDRLVSRIFFIEDGMLKEYSGNYSEFELQRAVEEVTLTREAEKVSKKIADLEEYIRRHGAGIKAKQARGRETQLKKITPVSAPKSAKSLSLHFGQQTRAGDKVLNLDNISVAYHQREIFRNVHLELRRGDKVALLGKNGIGKTSLLKAIIGRISYQGSVRIGANVSIGYFSQEHEDMGQRDTVIDEIRYSSKYEDPQIRNILAAFGFRGENVFKPLHVLSGGEKSRLALCKLFLAKGNLLLLDEPTNHLDMDTREVLEEALLEYDGTIVTVSHDRYFINRIMNKIAVLTPSGLRLIEGDYTTYRETAEMENSINSQTCDIENEKISTAKSYQEESRNNRRREKKIKQLEDKIEEVEELLRLTAHELESLSGDYEQILELHNQYENLQEELDNLMQEWIVFME